MLNRTRFAVSVLGLGMLLNACAEGDTSTAPAAATPAVAEADIQTLMATADADKGKVLFLQCRACHSLEAGGANKVGPNLHGFMGRKAGLAPGFNYSEVVTGSNIVWSAATLDAWLARPSDFLPGNRMVFVGIRKAEDRANLIAFLQRETAAAASK